MSTENTKENSNTSDSSHGVSDSKMTYVRIILGLPLIFFAIWVTIGHFGAMSLIPEWLMNPWTMFSVATTALLLYGGDYFIPVFKSIKERRLSITLFLVLSILIAYIYSLAIMIIYYDDHVKQFDMSMFEAVVEIMWIVYIGFYIEKIITKKANKDLESIVDLTIKKAIKIINGKEVEVETSSLVEGDIVIIKNGSKFPVDGIVIEGLTTVDESTFTGESIPVDKTKGSLVYGGTVSQGQTILMQVTKTFDESAISKIINSLYAARSEQSEPAKMSEKLSKFVLPGILIVSLLSLLIWGFTTNWNKGIEIFVTTMIVACPMSFILLSPTSTLIASSAAAKKGIMFNKPNIFEKYKDISSILFDKTGTLTDGKIKVINSTIPKEFNSLVYSMEKVSAHPIAKAITSYFDTEQLDIKSTEEIGMGVKVEYNNTTYYFGSFTYVKNNTSALIEDSEKNINSKKTGSTFSYLSNGKELLGSVELRDTINKTSFNVVNELLKKNIKPYIVSGDNEYSVKYVAKELNIPLENTYWDQTPESKRDLVKKLQSEGEQVLFIGDGINDAIALETSNVGLSVSSGSDLAIESSDVILMNNNLELLISAMDISKGTLNVIKYGNLVASIWIVSIVSVSAAGLLAPVFGAVAMVINDTIPIFVSMTLFRFNKKDKKSKNPNH